ncbi:MAG: hypothetical protein II699_03505 [Lachnospiraceae bacterium]|nr:hypothetical protein [Lachnospiraceae bacterium]
MKSDLYKIIYRVACFCVFASTMLLFGEIFISYKVMTNGARSQQMTFVIVLALVLGVLLVAASIFVAIYFKKCYNLALQYEELKAEEAAMVESFKAEIENTPLSEEESESDGQ